MTDVWRRAYALDALVAGVLEIYPTRDHGSDGSIGDAAHQADTASDHNPVNGIVHAQDFDADVIDGDRLVGPWLAAALFTGRDPRIKYVIWNGRIFYGSDAWASLFEGPGRKAFVWYPYYGEDNHASHLHISVVPTQAADDRRPWQLGKDWLEMASAAEVREIVKEELTKIATDKNHVYWGQLDRKLSELLKLMKQASSDAGDTVPPPTS